MKNINNLVDEMIAESVNLKQYIKYLEDGMEYFEVNFTGKLQSEKLLPLVEKAFKDKDLQFVLTGLLFCSDKESITDEIFRKLCKFRVGLRKSFMGTLAHCDISFYQLMDINRMKICFEAFGWLMKNMYISDAFSTEDMRQLLKESAYIKSVWADVFASLLSLDVEASPAKKAFLDKLLCDNK